MKTVGQVLKEARLAQKLELDQITAVTKIRPQSLLLLEADNFQKLPNATVARGFISNYAQVLGLKPKQLQAIFRRDFVENNQGQIVPRGMVDPVGRSSLWTPKSTIIAVVVSLIVIFFSYLTYQYWQLLGPPSLILSHPTADLVTSESTIEVMGKTDPEATISVNGQPVVLEKGGRFYVRLPLQEGPNQLIVIAHNKTGKSTLITHRIILDTKASTP